MKLLLSILFLTQCLLANIGSISALRGDATIERKGATIPAKMGDAILEHDVIQTGNNAKMQIILSDRTVITLGKESRFEIQNYFYEKENKASNTQVKMEKGFFKTITGKIGKLSPEKFTLKTQNSTIGIRGTQILSQLDPTRGIEKIACIQGSITVSDGERVANVNANQIVERTPAGNMSPVRRMTSNDRNQMNAGFAPAKKEEKQDQKAEQSTQGTSKSEKENKEEKSGDKDDSKEENQESQDDATSEDESSNTQDDSTQESTDTEETPVQEESAPVEFIIEDTTQDQESVTTSLTQDITQVITDALVVEAETAIEEATAATTDPVDTIGFEVPSTDTPVSIDPF